MKIMEKNVPVVDTHGGRTMPEPLQNFYLTVRCTANLFAGLNRQWKENSGTIAKVCAFYLVNAKMSRREKRKFTEFMDRYFHLHCQMSACNDFVGQLHGHYHRQESELRQLLEQLQHSVAPQATEPRTGLPTPLNTKP